MTWLWKTHVGRQTLAFGAGKISQVDISTANEKHGKTVKVLVHEKKSHMYGAREYLDFLDSEARDLTTYLVVGCLIICFMMFLI